MATVITDLGVFAGAAQRNCVREVRSRMMRSRISGVISDLTHPDCAIIACNDGFTRMTGYSEPETIGQNCRFLNRGRIDAGMSRDFHRSIRAGRPFSAELKNYRKDGTPFLNGVTLSPIYGKNGDLVAMLGSQIDLTGYDPTCRLQAFHRAREKLTRLSDRQFEVILRMAQGKLIKEIAYDLDIASRTVKLHRAAAIRTLGVSNSVEAIRVAIEAGY